MSSSSFNTIQYCIDNKIPCFTFQMDSSKKCPIKWGDITLNNFTEHLKHHHNGFAIITGEKYIVIDFDSKHNPPHSVYDILYSNCECVEQTPSGFHFWYVIDSRTAHFMSTVGAYWDCTKLEGIDIRAKNGICYTAPSQYKSDIGQIKKYRWLKGNLNTATVMPSEILEHINYTSPEFNDAFTFTVTKEPDITTIVCEGSNNDDVLHLLNGLSQDRVDNYHEWISVGLALKNSGYSCELWDEWSRRSSKYTPGKCHREWDNFKRRESNAITVASLYWNLKKDNYPLFLELTSSMKDLQNNLLHGTHAHIADVFHSLNPHSYLYTTVNGWYILRENNTWLQTGIQEIYKLPGIYNKIRGDCEEILLQVIQKLGKNSEEDNIRKQKILDTYKKLCNSSFLKGVLGFLTGHYTYNGTNDIFNQNKQLFAFENGVIDLDTMTMREIRPTDYITFTCGYDYRPANDDEKSIVRNFLMSIFPNESVCKYMTCALSTSLEGENRGEFFHALTGVGANGKSSLIDLCKVVLGDYFRTIAVSYLTKDDNGKDKPLPDLVDARYSRMLIASEPEEKDKFQISLLKLITGGDEVSCRAMYGRNVVKYVAQYKLWIMTNDLPRLSKYDQGIERRMRCVHFPVRFVSNPRNENERLRDETLKTIIRHDEQWRYGFLGLLLDAFAESRGTVLEMPPDVKDFTGKYMMENNPVGAWLRNYYEITNNRSDVVQKTELFRAFIQDTGETKTQKSFNDDLHKCNINEKIIKGVKYYFGIVRNNITENE